MVIGNSKGAKIKPSVLKPVKDMQEMFEAPVHPSCG